MTRCYAAGLAPRARRGRRDDDGGRRRRCHARPVPDDRPADLVLRGGRIATMDPARRVVEALAVVDGRIAAVGPEAAVRRWIGPRTRVVDLRGRTVTPGFGDAHVHPVTSGLDRLRCDLTGVRGLTAYLAVIAAYAASHPDEPGSVAAAGRWPISRRHRGSRRSHRVAPDRPGTSRVATATRPGSTAWRWHEPGSRRRPPIRATGGSSATARGARSARSRRVPECRSRRPAIEHGRGARRGAPARPGRAPRARHHQLAGRACRGHDRRRVHDAGRPRRAQRPGRRGAGLGRDAWRRADRGAGRAAGRDGAAALRADERQVLRRWHPRELHGRRARAVSRPPRAAHLEPRRQPDRARHLRGGRHAARRARVPGPRPRHRRSRRARGARRHRGRATGQRDERTRPQIAHLQLVHPDDLGRFRALGVVADVQAYWAVLEDQMEELTIPFVGPERAGRMYPIGSLLRAGATIAMGSDWSVSTADPLLQMEVAVERVSDEHRGRRPAFLPDERIGLDDALAGSPSARPGPTTSRARSDRSRSARRPTSRCSIATCSTVGRVRSARPGWWPRSSTARRRTSGPRSAADQRVRVPRATLVYPGMDG